MVHIENRSYVMGCSCPTIHYLTFETFSKKACRIEEIFVPLQCQMREVTTPPIKDKNCED